MHNEAKKLIKELYKHVEQAEHFKEDETSNFIRFALFDWRRTGSGNAGHAVNYTVWYNLITESDTQYVLKNNQGFKVHRKLGAPVQQVISTIGTIELLCSKDHKNRDVANAILNQLSLLKYGEQVKG